jgi:hypothetical protein
MKTKEAVKHTPGPWATDDCSVVHANGEPIAEIYDGRKTFRADARLIAAAPELLAALISTLRALEQHIRDDARKAGVKVPDYCPCDSEECLIARAAILRATGGK